MGIKVYGYPFSGATQRVLATLAEKELEYEFVNIDLGTGQQKTQDFLKLQPFGQVPALQDGDLTLFESRAITRYLAHTYADKGTPLITADPKKMATIAVWLEVEGQRFDPHGVKLVYEIVVNPRQGRTTDETVVQQLEAKLAECLDVYEARLAESKYLGGDSFSLADLHHLPIVSYLMGCKVKGLFDARPRVSAWCADILARPSWLKVVALMKH